MPLPSTGTISLSMVDVELGGSGSATLSIDEQRARTLAQRPVGEVTFTDFYGKAATTLQSYYGLSSVAIPSSAVVATLAAATVVLPHQFTLTAAAGQFMYWASPVSMGLVQFFDLGSQFTGGWDGAQNDPMRKFGPVVLSINGHSYYVYRTDYASLGRVPWEAQVHQ